MKKIIFVLLAFLAVFTYIRVNDNAKAENITPAEARIEILK